MLFTAPFKGLRIKGSINYDFFDPEKHQIKKIIHSGLSCCSILKPDKIAGNE